MIKYLKALILCLSFIIVSLIRTPLRIFNKKGGQNK